MIESAKVAQLHTWGLLMEWTPAACQERLRTLPLRAINELTGGRPRPADASVKDMDRDDAVVRVPRRGALAWRNRRRALPVAKSLTPSRSSRGPRHDERFDPLAGDTVRVEGQTLLQAARGAKVPLPSLCERGVCGTCKVRVCSGAVDVGAARALSEQERASGYVLACVAHPASAATVELEAERDVRSERPAAARPGRPR